MSGVIEDKWTSQSRFYVARSQGKVVGTCRAIDWSDDHRLPTVDYFDLDLGALGLDDAASHGRLTEISALATDRTEPDAVLAAAGLYRVMFQHDALASRSDVWIFNVEEWLLRAFQDDFGFLAEAVGPERYYYGDYTVPVALDLRATAAAMVVDKPDLLSWFMEGLPEGVFPVAGLAPSMGALRSSE